MGEKSSLENKARMFDWKEWVPFMGLYVAPRNILRGNKSLEGREVLNGFYHGLVSVAPAVLYVVYQLTDN